VMDIFNMIAERKISEAIQRGEFENLALKGTRLDLREASHIPAELQMGYHILKNAGVIPEELTLGKEIQSLRDLLANCVGTPEEPEVSRKLRNRLLQLNILLEKRGRSIALQEYASQLDRLEP